MLRKLMNIDRRILYGVVWIVILFPLVKPLGLPLRITPEVQASFDWINANVKAGDVVFIDVDFDPSSAPELLPQMIALSKYLMKKDVKIILGSYLPGGFMYQAEVVEKVAPEFGFKYGEDIISLPYKAGNEGAYNALGRGIKILYAEDFYGDVLANMPLWQNFEDVSDLKCFFCFCAGDQAVWAIRHVGQTTGLPIFNGTVASSGAFMTPYWESRQLCGFIVGMSGAAEFEKLTGFIGRASAGMDAQSFGHILITTFVILGNVGYLAAKKRGEVE